MQTVKNDKHAIGYISLGSINDEIKALSIDGIYPSLENVQNGKYTVIRTFNLVIKEKNELIEDFLNFIASSEGNKVILDNQYIPILSKEYKSTKVKRVI